MLGLALVMSGCMGGLDSISPGRTPSAVPLSAEGDPTPQIGRPRSVGSQGGRVESVGVTVDVPTGAVPGGVEFEVAIGQAIGQVAGSSASETYGAPVQVEHSADLNRPVRLAWDVSALTPEQRASLVLVRWDPALGVWNPTSEPAMIDGTTLSADVTQFSIINWVSSGAATISQTVGQWTGKRAEAPECATGALPGWVTTVVRPDADQPAMPIRTCTEPDKNRVLTVRVANNRPYTQSLDLTQGGRYAWTWAGEQDYTVAGIIRDTVNGLMSTDKTLLMAPARATAIGLSRPATPGSVQLTMAAHPTVATVTEDIIVALLENVVGLDNVSGFDSKLINTFAQTLYDCGGKQVLKSRDVVGSDTFGKVLETVKSCTESDQVATAVENVVRARIADGGTAAASAIKTNRILKGALGKLGTYLTVADFSSYTAELSSSAPIGDVKISVFGTGTAPGLGDWTATCTNADTDSTALYKNLAQQDAYFTHQSEELSEIPTWQRDSGPAVKPLAKCRATHMERVARDVETAWADKKAAAVVAARIRTLAAAAPDGSLIVLNGDGIGPFKFGAAEKDVLAYLTPALGKPSVEGGLGGCEGAGFGWQSYAAYGPLRVRFAGADDSATSRRTMESWQIELSSARVGQLTLAKEIPFGLSLKQLQTKYPDGGGLEHMDAWAAGGVLLIPPAQPGGSETIHAGGLDWCT